MLQKLSTHIGECWLRAEEEDRRAGESTDARLRTDHERMAKSWRHLARSYQFIESLERFLIDAKKARDALPPEPPVAE